MKILVLNGGSSSIKFSMYLAANDAHAGISTSPLLEGELDGVGSSTAKLRSSSTLTAEADEVSVDAKTVDQAIQVIFRTVAKGSTADPNAIGYRVVHPGAKLHDHQRVTPAVLEDLEGAVEFAPLHNPEVVQIIRAAMKRFPGIPHFVCFDTIFHETMPVEATTYPLPPEYRERGVRRYGFHGLSCESIVRQLRDRGELPRRMVIAHLGSGCSVTALIDGCSVDTTMGLTPTGGVLMGTRSGDLDPGLVLYLLRQQTETKEGAITAVETLLNHDSGIVALSGMANDVKAVRAAADGGNQQAALALRVFTRSVIKAIGSYCWLLGGLDGIVFSGGIGEHDAETRKEVLGGVEGLGVELVPLDTQAAAGGMRRLSSSDSKTAVFIVPAQEDLIIALHVERMIRAEM